jgi:hypothetical protein
MAGRVNEGGFGLALLQSSFKQCSIVIGYDYPSLPIQILPKKTLSTTN